MKLLKFLCVVFLLSLFSCKKSKSEPVNNPTPVVTYKKIKSSRTVNSTSTSTTNSIFTFSYNASGRMDSNTQLDSTTNGSGTWNVSTYNVIYEYNSLYRFSSIIYIFGGITAMVNYKYDSSGKILYEINNSNDTIIYTHTGNKSTSQPKKTSPNYSISYYTNGDIDSALNINSGTIGVTKYNYNSKKDLTYAYFISSLPLNPEYKEIGSTSYNYGGSSISNSIYSYVYDNDGYPVKITITTPPTLPNITYFTYY